MIATGQALHLLLADQSEDTVKKGWQEIGRAPERFPARVLLFDLCSGLQEPWSVRQEQKLSKSITPSYRPDSTPQIHEPAHCSTEPLASLPARVEAAW